MTVLERQSFTYRFIAGLHAELGARGFIVYLLLLKTQFLTANITKISLLSLICQYVNITKISLLSLICQYVNITKISLLSLICQYVNITKPIHTHCSRQTIHPSSPQMIFRHNTSTYLSMHTIYTQSAPVSW